MKKTKLITILLSILTAFSINVFAMEKDDMPAMEKDIIKINNNKNTYCDDDIKNIKNSEKSEDINILEDFEKFNLFVLNKFKIILTKFKSKYVSEKCSVNEIDVLYDDKIKDTDNDYSIRAVIFCSPPDKEIDSVESFKEYISKMKIYSVFFFDLDGFLRLKYIYGAKSKENLQYVSLYEDIMYKIIYPPKKYLILNTDLLENLSFYVDLPYTIELKKSVLKENEKESTIYENVNNVEKKYSWEKLKDVKDAESINIYDYDPDKEKNLDEAFDEENNYSKKKKSKLNEPTYFKEQERYYFKNDRYKKKNEELCKKYNEKQEKYYEKQRKEHEKKYNIDENDDNDYNYSEYSRKKDDCIYVDDYDDFIKTINDENIKKRVKRSTTTKSGFNRYINNLIKNSIDNYNQKNRNIVPYDKAKYSTTKKFLIRPIEGTSQVNIMKLSFDEKNINKLKKIVIYAPLKENMLVKDLSNKNNLVKKYKLIYNDEKNVIEKQIYGEISNGDAPFYDKKYKICYDEDVAERNYVDFKDLEISNFDETNGKIYENIGKVKKNPTWEEKKYEKNENDMPNELSDEFNQYYKNDYEDDFDQNGENELSNYYDNFFNVQPTTKNIDIELEDKTTFKTIAYEHQEKEEDDADENSIYFKSVIIDEINEKTNEVYSRKILLHKKSDNSDPDKKFIETYYYPTDSNLTFKEFFEKNYINPIVRLFYDENGKICKKHTFPKILEHLKKVYIVIYPKSLNLEQPPEDKNPNELAISKFDYDNGEEIKGISFLFA